MVALEVLGTWAVVGVLVVAAIVFIIKSLVKFAIGAAAIAIIIFVAWQLNLIPFL